MLRCRLQKPRRCDSLLQPSLLHRRRHCLPLNFLRMPLGVDTTSPLLYLCGVAAFDLCGDIVEVKAGHGSGIEVTAEVR